MAGHGAGTAAGTDAASAEVLCPHPSLASGHHSWSSSTGIATVPWSWNYSVDDQSQDTVYYDPERDVLNSGGNENLTSSTPLVVQSTIGMESASYSHVPYSSSLQHGYNSAEYANYYYNYTQTTNDSSVQQDEAKQNSGAAYQTLTSFQNSGSYIGPTSNTYYNAGGHQTTPGYGASSYYHQNSAWNGGSSGNDYNQSYQNYSSSDTNAVQGSSLVPGNSLPFQQQYNQWPYYYNHPVPSTTGNSVAGNSSTNNGDVGTTSGYSYPSVQPPPPGSTTWKSNSTASVVPIMQAPGVPEPQIHYVNQARDMPGLQNQYVSQAPAIPQNTVNLSHVALSSYEDQQKTVSVTTDTSSENKMQISTDAQIAPDFSMVILKSEKKNLGADLAKKPAYVSVSMPKNDAKVAQLGFDTRSLPFSLSNYAKRNFSHCKDDAQRAACQKIIDEIKDKATADGTLLTKNWDIEPLFPLPETVITMTGTSSSNNLSPSSTSTPRKRLKSRWEPVVEERATDKAHPLANGLVNGSSHSIFEAKNMMGHSLDFKKFLQFRQPPLNKVSKRSAKKQRIGRFSSVMQNGNTSSDSDKEKDLTKYYSNASALANSPEKKKRRDHRSKRFEKSKDSSSKLRNLARYKDAIATHKTVLLTRSYEDSTSLPVEDMDWDALTVKGTCEEIEKRYLRLTSAPDPATVRPEHVLEKAISMVETSQKNYLYKCDQLKSIRQDLTVQRIQNELTVKVYETHVRLAMQAGDLPEYNQCQSQLKRLYAEGMDGCYFEFSAYNLLCVMLHSNNKRDLLSSMASLSKEAKEDGAVKHALAVHSAVSSGNYVLFFKLYKQAPNLNSCLMDLYVERMRFEAIKCMSRSYRPTVPTGYIARSLGFSKSEYCIISESNGSEECEAWLKAHGGILSSDSSGESQLDTKASSTTLHMPEPENAVAHGDASLAVNDFFAQTS